VPSLETFKPKQLKTHLFKQSYDNTAIDLLNLRKAPFPSAASVVLWHYTNSLIIINKINVNNEVIASRQKQFGEKS